ncbi:MAG: hypothetical protein Tsb009_35390 [Planctomycetaceae bacterium]
MPSDIETLKTLVKPPESPKASGGNWEEVEKHLGITFPPDYKEFISIYGTGSLQSFMHIWNYLDVPADSDAKEVIKQITSEYEWDREHGRPVEFVPYPQPGGLIPFASTDDGNYLNWQTTGKPSEWCVVAYDCGPGRLIYAEGVNMVRCIRMLVQKDNPFGDAFCNVESFNPPVSYNGRE